MQFATKRELLEHLGKNPDDRKLVDRMILRWEVFREDGMYYLVTNKQSLIDEVRDLKMKLREFEDLRPLTDWEKDYLVKVVGENKRLANELKDEKINSEYAQRSYEEVLADRRFRLEKAFQWIKAHVKWASWDEFYEWVMSDEE